MNGSMSPSILHGVVHADHMPPLAATPKLTNMHMIFDPPLSYCHVLLAEVRSACKSRECTPSDTQTGGKTSSVSFLSGNSPWTSP